MRSNLFEKQFGRYFFLCLIPWERRNRTGTVASSAVENLFGSRRPCLQKHEGSFNLVTAVYFIRKPVCKNRC